MLQGEYVPNTFVWSRTSMDQVRKGHQRNVNFQVLYCIRWSRTEGSGAEFGDLIRSSGLGSGSGCAPTPRSGPSILSDSHIYIYIQKYMLSPLLSTMGGGVQILSNIYVPMHGLLPCCFLAVCLENRGPISGCQVAE